MRSPLRTSVGVVLALLGASLLWVTLGSGGHIHSPRHANAFVAWHNNPSASTEAAWLREKARMARFERTLVGLGALSLAGGTWLACTSRREQRVKR